MVKENKAGSFMIVISFVAVAFGALGSLKAKTDSDFLEVSSFVNQRLLLVDNLACGVSMKEANSTVFNLHPNSFLKETRPGKSRLPGLTFWIAHFGSEHTIQLAFIHSTLVWGEEWVGWKDHDPSQKAMDGGTVLLRGSSTTIDSLEKQTYWIVRGASYDDSGMPLPDGSE